VTTHCKVLNLYTYVLYNVSVSAQCLHILIMMFQHFERNISLIMFLIFFAPQHNAFVLFKHSRFFIPVTDLAHFGIPL